MIAFFVAALMLYGPYVWCHLRKEPFSAYGLDWSLSTKALGETLLVTAATLTPLTVIALRWPGLSLPHNPSLKVALLQITAGAVSAIVEEVFFRGWLQTLLARKLPFSAALLLTTALFAVSHRIAHPEPIFLATFFPGLVMGLLRHRHGTVTSAALYHGLGNLWAVWFFPLP